MHTEGGRRICKTTQPGWADEATVLERSAVARARDSLGCIYAELLRLASLCNEHSGKVALYVNASLCLHMPGCVDARICCPLAHVMSTAANYHSLRMESAMQHVTLFLPTCSQCKLCTA